MSIEMPKFNLKITTADFKAAEEPQKKERKFFDPGEYTLRIIKAEFRKMSSDPTWAVYGLTLGGLDSREMKHTLLVPTSKLTFTKPGNNPTHLPYHNYKDFLRALGQDIETPEDLAVLTKTVFSNPARLEGETLKVLIGYDKVHVALIPGSNTFALLNRDGSRVVETEFPDRDSAVAHAAFMGIVAQTFANVVKIYPKIAAPASESANPWND